MKDPIRIAAAQFETAENDKPRNIETMSRFIVEASRKQVDVICFPEACLTGYHFWTESTREQLLKVGELVEDGPVTRQFAQQAKRFGMLIIWGMLGKDRQDNLFNTAVVVGPEGFVFKHRKVHAFENSAIRQGERLDTFEMLGWNCAILICYDNNLPENNRVVALKGAEIVFAPHQTGGFDIPRAGMGRIAPEVWHNRLRDPVTIRQEMMGPKGQEWQMKWLPSRAYDNGAYLVYVNGIGIDGPEVRTGCSMIFDPEGIVIAESTAAADDMIVADFFKDNLNDTLPRSHIATRRPSLYNEIVEPIEEIDTRIARNRISREKIK